MNRIHSFILCILLPFQVINSRQTKFKYDADEEESEYWLRKEKIDLENSINLKRVENKAKNVILFIGDGMGISTLTAARILKGQLQHRSGEEGALSFERFPYASLIKTYNVDRQVPDSAGTATAFLCGVKASYETLKVNAKIRSGDTDCDAIETNKVTSIMDWANDAGKSTGVVTTTRITHATPAASYASTSTRYWESDSDLPLNVTGKCKDIARQLIENKPGSQFRVILGGGRKNFFGINDDRGVREDGRNLVQLWKNKRLEDHIPKHAFHYISNAKELRQLNLNKTEYLLGLFSKSHMNYDKERSPEEPSLSEMTETAIRILSKNENGFVLLVEGGRIDQAHHDNLASMALHETLALEKAVMKAEQLTSPEDTLIIVTADHSHSLTINGYPIRGQSIFGYANETGNHSYPYTVLLYANGPGYKEKRDNPLEVDTSGLRYTPYAAVHVDEAAHTGEDVALYSIGPKAHLFHGLHEQSYIAHVIAYASCIGRYSQETHCGHTSNASSRHALVLQLTILSLITRFLAFRF